MRLASGRDKPVPSHGTKTKLLLIQWVVKTPFNIIQGAEAAAAALVSCTSVPRRAGGETCMEQTTTGAQRPAAIVPWEVGVAGPEAASARSGSEAPDRLWGATTPVSSLCKPLRARRSAATADGNSRAPRPAWRGPRGKRNVPKSTCPWWPGGVSKRTSSSTGSRDAMHARSPVPRCRRRVARRAYLVADGLTGATDLGGRRTLVAG